MRAPSTTEQLANAIESLVASYVDEVRQAAEQALARALCRPSPAVRPPRGKGVRPPTPRSTTKRRTASELDEVCERLCALVRARPGESIVTLAEEVGEDVLFFASQLGMEENDFRVLNVLCKWIDVHAERINVDRLTRLVEAGAVHERTRAFWAAVGQWQHRDGRFARLAALRSACNRIDLFLGTDFQIQRRGGEHPWFAGTCLRARRHAARSAERRRDAEAARQHHGRPPAALRARHRNASSTTLPTMTPRRSMIAT
jgi:hypothetical protein